MWLKVSEEIYLPGDDVVGFFGPGVLAGGSGPDGADGAGRDRGGRADALMRNGRVIAMPFRLKALAGRLAGAAGGQITAGTGE